MPDEVTEEATGREREVLRTRRESRERLGDRAFALNLEQALGVPEPDTASSIREAFGGLAPRHDRRGSANGGRPDRPEAGHGQARVPGPARPVGRHPAGRQPGHRAGRPRAAGGGGSRRHRRCDRPGRDHAQGRAVDLRRAARDAHQGAPAAAREVARPQGSRAPTATALPPPRDRPRRAEAAGRRARGHAARDPRVPGRARLRRGRDAGAADDRGRGDGASVRDAPPRSRHGPVPADLARAAPEAPARGRPRTRLRDRAELPQRGRGLEVQPRVHDARALPGLRRLRDDDGGHARSRAGERARGGRLAPGLVPGQRHRSRRGVAPRDGARERVRGRRRGGHARASGPRRARGAPRRAGRPVLARGQDRARAVREARRARVDPADVRPATSRARCHRSRGRTATTRASPSTSTR